MRERGCSISELYLELPGSPLSRRLPATPPLDGGPLLRRTLPLHDSVPFPNCSWRAMALLEQSNANASVLLSCFLPAMARASQEPECPALALPHCRSPRSRLASCMSLGLHASKRASACTLGHGPWFAAKPAKPAVAQKPPSLRVSTSPALPA